MIECFKLRAHRIKGSLHIDYLFLPSTGLVTLIGETGSGKTTLLKSLAGLTEHFGKIIIDDALKQQKYTSNFTYNNFKDYHRYEADSFRETLFNMMGIYGLTDRGVILENAKKHLRTFDLTLNTVYESCNRSERTLFTLALILSLERNVVLLDELFENLDVHEHPNVIATLKEYSQTHLVIVSLSPDSIKLPSNKTILLRNGSVVEESEVVMEHFNTPKFKHNSKFNLATFSLLPHLKPYAKLLISLLTVFFTFTIMLISLPGTTRNTKAFEEITSNFFINVSARHEGYKDDIYIDSSNHLLSLTYDNVTAKDFKIRPDYIKGTLVETDEHILSLSTPLAKLLNVDGGDSITLSGLSWTVNTVHDIEHKELYLPLNFFLTMAHLETSNVYYMDANNYDCTFYDVDGTTVDKTAFTKYFSYGLVIDESLPKDSYGFYRINSGYVNPDLVILSNPDYNELRSSEATNYAFYYRNIFNLNNISRYEPSSFIYNDIGPNILEIVVVLITCFIYLCLILALCITADKRMSDYYKSFNKNKYVLLQALKFFSFTLIVLFASFLLMTTIIREGYILLTTGVISLGTLCAFFILYLIVGRLYVKDW